MAIGHEMPHVPCAFKYTKINFRLEEMEISKLFTMLQLQCIRAMKLHL